MNIADTLEQIVLQELIGSAHKKPETAHGIFRESLEQLEKLVAAKGKVDFRFVSKLANLMMNSLPKTEGDRICNESNRIMAEKILSEMRKHKSQPVSYFAHEDKPCNCPVCKAKDHKVHLAN